MAANSPTVDVPALVFHIDLLLLAIAGAFVLSTLPRFFFAIRHSPYLYTGYFLRGSSNVQVPSVARDYALRRSQPQSNAYIGSEHEVHTTDCSPPLDPYATHIFIPSSGGAVMNKAQVPTRMPSWLTFTHPVVVSVLNVKVLPGLTFLRSMIVLSIFTVLSYAGFYRSNPFSNPVREGYIAMAIFPLVVAVACKNNVLTWLSGVGYEKLNWLHRALGTILVLCANLHGVGKIYNWAIQEKFYTYVKLRQFQYALVALAGLDLLFLGSRQFVRSKSYTLFLLTHFVGFIAAAVGMVRHWPVTTPYVLAGVIVYAVDRVLRLIRTHTTTVHCTAMQHLNNGTTHVHMPRLTRGFRSGQHVRIRVVDGTGVFSWIRALAFSRPRPFTLASRPLGSGAELYIKKENGVFTTSLYKMASGEVLPSFKGSDKIISSPNVEAGTPMRAVRMLVEGPYGGPSYTIFESYSGVVLVAGGSGISFVLGVLDDLLEAHAAGRSRVRVIEVVWAVADPASLTALLPTLRRLLRPRPSPHTALDIRVAVQYTRAGGRGPFPERGRVPIGVHLDAGRPNLLKTLEATIDRVLDDRTGPAPPRKSGIAAAACGPEALVAQLAGAVGSLSWDRWRDVGGVETISEAFTF